MSSNIAIEFKCKNCGGKLDVTPETLVAICSYCGTPNWFVESSEEIMIVPSVSRDEILKSFLTRVSEDFDLKRIANKIQIVEVAGFYIPFYFFSIKVEGFYEGWKTERVVESRGRSVQTRTRRRKVSERFSSILKVPILGRRSAEDFSLNELASYYKYSNPKAVPISDFKNFRDLKMTFLRSEIGVDEASMIARDDAGDIMRSKISSKVDELTKFVCSTKILEKSPIILLPYWYVIYSYGDSIYRVAYAGWDKHMLLAQEPVMIYHRLQYFAGVLSGCLISAFGFTSLFSWGVDPIFSILGLIAGCIVSWFFGKKLVSDVRIEGVKL
ncbi:MAG: hypothetical protein QXM35_01105 [Candidatus Methanomethylicia archaeon]